MDHAAIHEAATFLREHLGEPVGVREVADHVGYSPAHLARAFSAHLGLGPGAYQAAVRFHAAKRLLLRGHDPVTDVCADVGFDSLPTFTRRFRDAVGVTPARFRALADRVSEGEQRAFSLTVGRAATVSITLHRPDHLVRGPWLAWLGWYPTPLPVGLPHAGRLHTGGDHVELPLCASAPWLLGFTVDPAAEVGDHLAPVQPYVAAHPQPLFAPTSVHLRFAPAAMNAVPLLSALPVLRER